LFSDYEGVNVTPIVYLLQTLSLSRMAEKAFAEDEKAFAELEEANARLEETNAELPRRELDEETEHCERLRRCNARLLNERNEVRNSVTALEAKLAETEASAAKSSAASKKRFGDFCSNIIGDLAPLCEAYERNINSLGGICSPIHSGAPSVEHYIRYLKSEVDLVFAGVNENFVSVAVEGVRAGVGKGEALLIWRLCGVSLPATGRPFTLVPAM
jgi:predicted nuclease with TOPRIM domain